VLLGLSGTDRAVLTRCPSELEARTGLGVAVVIPTVLAGLGGAVALVNLDASPLVVAVGAVGFAGIIGAVDRLMVTTAHSVSGLVVRVVISLATAWLIGEQLLLAAFASEVEAELAAIHADQITTATEEITTTAEADLADIDARLAELDTADAEAIAATELADVEDQLAVELAELEALQGALADEIAGDAGSGRAGDGPAADARRAEITVAEAAVAEATTRRDRAAAALDAADTTSGIDTATIDGLLARRSEIEAGRDAGIAAAVDRIQSSTGIIARIEALEHLGRTPLMAAQIWALRALLLAIDTLPLTAKIAYHHRRHRPYDATVEALAALEVRRADQLRPAQPARSTAGEAACAGSLPASAKPASPIPAVTELPVLGTGKEPRELPSDASADQVRARIAELLDAGHTSTAEIAALIGRAPRTVRTYRQALTATAS
jgi:hypothetical protein